jgi:hypothetical protein
MVEFKKSQIMQIGCCQSGEVPGVKKMTFFSGWLEKISPMFIG